MIPFWVDIGVVAVFSLAIFALALGVRLHPEQTQRHIENLDPMFEETEGDAADQNLTRAA